MALGRLRPARTSSCALAPTFAGTTARRLAPRSVVAAIVLALCAALWLASAAPASAINSKAAGNKTLAALGSTKGTDAVIVFGLTKPLRAGTKVTLASAKKPAPLVVKVGSERAFFFYEDLAPSRPYPHPGLVALVGVKSGKVTLSKTIMWRPLVNGKLPAFLRTSKLYRSSKYRVYYRPKSGPAEPVVQPGTGQLTTEGRHAGRDGEAGQAEEHHPDRLRRRRRPDHVRDHQAAGPWHALGPAAERDLHAERGLPGTRRLQLQDRRRPGH